MKKIVILLFICVVFVASVSAELNGWALWLMWKDYQRLDIDSEGPYTFADLKGSMYLGYVWGITETMGHMFLTIPSEINMMDICYVVGAYMDKDIPDPDDSASNVVYLAIKEHFPRMIELNDGSLLPLDSLKKE